MKIFQFRWEIRRHPYIYIQKLLQHFVIIQNFLRKLFWSSKIRFKKFPSSYQWKQFDLILISKDCAWSSYLWHQTRLCSGIWIWHGLWLVWPLRFRNLFIFQLKRKYTFSIPFQIMYTTISTNTHQYISVLNTKT